jgi:hypothetical protein
MFSLEFLDCLVHILDIVIPFWEKIFIRSSSATVPCTELFINFI